jgi:cystathionine beta-lyase/cystathionine gamma-synthase
MSGITMFSKQPAGGRRSLYLRYAATLREIFATALGEVASLATQTLTTTHHDLTPEERSRRGITDGMICLFVGLANPEELIGDLEQARR